MVVVAGLIGVVFHLAGGSKHGVSSPPSTVTSVAGAPSPPAAGVQITSPPTGSFNVLSYGADRTGQKDSTEAIRNAIAAAASSGHWAIVYFPAGSYLLDDDDGRQTDFDLDGERVDILGAGPSVTKIVEKVGTVSYPDLQRGKTVFVFSDISRFYFSGLTVDAQTYNAGDTLDDYGNDSVIENAAFMGGQNGSGRPVDATNVFDLRVLAVCSLNRANPHYGVFRSGNTVRDVVLSGRGTGGNDDLDFSCQHHGTISKIVDTGWGTALYYDQDVTVSNYRFTPGQQSQHLPGWYITGSQNVTISGFTTSGSGGIISNPQQRTTGTVITDETMTDPGYTLSIGDADDTTITDSHLDQIVLDPSVGLHGLTVSNSLVGSVVSEPKGTATVSGVTGVTVAAG